MWRDYSRDARSGEVQSLHVRWKRSVFGKDLCAIVLAAIQVSQESKCDDAGILLGDPLSPPVSRSFTDGRYGHFRDELIAIAHGERLNNVDYFKCHVQTVSSAWNGTIASESRQS
jgi:hypothetical protein